jgi:site-specific recombinase XerD
MAKDTLKNLLPRFIDDLQDKGRSPSTKLAYRADLDQLVLYLQEKNIVLPEDVQPNHLESFRESLLSQKYTPKSVSRKLNAIKTFFRWLVSDEVITSDPSRHVAHPKIEVSTPKFLSQLEYRALRDLVRSDVRVATIIELVLQTGMRISEVANLKISNIKDRKIKVEPYATQPERHIPMNSAAEFAISNYLPHRPKGNADYLFVSKNNKPLAVRNIRAAIDRYMQKANIPKYSVNDLRTTFIIENLRAGVDIVLLSQVAGHKRLSTTERYLEIAEVKEPGKKQSLQEL